MQSVNSSQSKDKRPPLCPKSPKASTIRIFRKSSSKISLTKKNQRAPENLPPMILPQASTPQCQPPLPKPRPSAPVQSVS